MTNVTGFRCRACSTPIDMQPGQIGTCRGCGRKNYAPASGFEYFTAVQPTALPGEAPLLEEIPEEVIVCAKCKMVSLAPPGMTVRCPTCGEVCRSSEMGSIVQLVAAPDYSAEINLRHPAPDPLDNVFASKMAEPDAGSGRAKTAELSITLGNFRPRRKRFVLPDFVIWLVVVAALGAVGYYLYKAGFLNR